ncbi:MAG: DUF1122 family protein [Thermofilum sp.]
MFCARALRALAERHRLGLVEKPGRFREEGNFELWLHGKRLLVAKCFSGRPPYYRQWAEIFAVLPRVEAEEGSFVFAGSALESELVGELAGGLEGGDALYFEYGYDPETEALLRLGLPPHVTRLGFTLFQFGFTFLKDFYFPEGFMEGGAKLRGEKPTSVSARCRYLARTIEEVREAALRLRELASDPRLGHWAVRALERSERVVNSIGQCP